MSMPTPIPRRRFLAGVAALAAARSPLVAALSDEKLSAAEKIIRTQVESGRLKAAALQVREGRTEVFARSFGCDPDAIFLIASITKPMTATGLMLLADRGELRIDDPVMKFISEFSVGDRRDITIRHLLTHTSGLPDQLPENAELRQRHAPLSEFVKGAIRTPLLFKPGSRYSYQSMGILLAAEIVQRISRSTIADFLAAEVFRPLGMRRTALGLGRFKLAEVIPSQTQSAAPESGSGSSAAKNWDWNSQYWRGLGAPWGGAHSTALDVTTFLRSFLHPEDRVLRPATARLMIQNHNRGLATPRGLGFDKGARLGKSLSAEAFGHSGSTGTLAWADPKTDRSLVLLTSLPSRASRETIINPVSDLLSG